MNRLSASCAALLCGLVAASTPSGAAEPPANARAFQTMIDCRSLTDDRARLACFDGAASVLDTAVRNGDVLVIERAQAQKANREAFGLHLPSLDILLPGLSADEVESQQSKIVAVQQLGNGRWLVTLESGAIWRQMDGELGNDPRVGDTVTLTKGSLGGFFLKIGAQPAVKAHRDE